MKITFLGGGNMANALIGGMLKQGIAASGITVIDPGSAARAKLAETYAVDCRESAEMLDNPGDLLVLAVTLDGIAAESGDPLSEAHTRCAAAPTFSTLVRHDQGVIQQEDRKWTIRP